MYITSYKVEGFFFHFKLCSNSLLMNLIHNICSGVANLKLLPHLPGTNDF